MNDRLKIVQQIARGALAHAGFMLSEKLMAPTPAQIDTSRGDGLTGILDEALPLQASIRHWARHP